ncbi:MAG: hypothetical protein MAG431_01865 [Chloroflexi bacterium]|nr:hypothetical protein [Chloroflexota bacterium]
MPAQYAGGVAGVSTPEAHNVTPWARDIEISTTAHYHFEQLPPIYQLTNLPTYQYHQPTNTMERTVPYTASEEVELYLRTYYSLLRTTDAIQIRTLEEVHSGMGSLLHANARGEAPDMSAFIYALLRLPDCVRHVDEIVLGQSLAVFQQTGVGDVTQWEPVSAPARRRRCFYNPEEKIMACIIASRSDIDDIIPLLTAYQIEWNKLHRLLQHAPDEVRRPNLKDDAALAWKTHRKLAETLNMSVEDLERWRTVCGQDFSSRLREIQESRQHFRVRLLSGSLIEYNRATDAWWNNIAAEVPELLSRPIYFISSNTHSLTNLLSGFALLNKEEIQAFLREDGHQELVEEWNQIKAQEIPSSEENFLYYAFKKYLQSKKGPEVYARRNEHEADCGIVRVDSEHFFDVDMQSFSLSQLNPEWFDPRVTGDEEDLSFLQDSDAMILNIDYPLGLSAYNILMEVAEHVGKILGVYIMGKAATLNGVVGDVMIPYVVHDEHSRNTYLCPTAFSAADVTPYLNYGTVLDNQKAVTVRGTFLQNRTYMDVFYREGYTDIEMEAGPYLSAVYEMFRPKRHPVDEIVTLDKIPFDLGILHYASDTPLNKGHNLGAGTLSYYGIDPTYATALAIIRRIIHLEKERLVG